MGKTPPAWLWQVYPKLPRNTVKAACVSWSFGQVSLVLLRPQLQLHEIRGGSVAMVRLSWDSSAYGNGMRFVQSPLVFLVQGKAMSHHWTLGQVPLGFLGRYFKRNEIPGALARFLRLFLVYKASGLRFQENMQWSVALAMFSWVSLSCGYSGVHFLGFWPGFLFHWPAVRAASILELCSSFSEFPCFTSKVGFDSWTSRQAKFFDFPWSTSKLTWYSCEKRFEAALC